jgi:hypothetical protein
MKTSESQTEFLTSIKSIIRGEAGSEWTTQSIQMTWLAAWNMDNTAVVLICVAELRPGIVAELAKAGIVTGEPGLATRIPFPQPLDQRHQKPQEQDEPLWDEDEYAAFDAHLSMDEDYYGPVYLPAPSITQFDYPFGHPHARWNPGDEDFICCRYVRRSEGLLRWDETIDL